MASEGLIEEAVTKFQGECKMKNHEFKKIKEFCLKKMTDAERKAERESIM